VGASTSPGASTPQWAAVVEPGVAGGCQGTDYLIPAAIWSHGIERPASYSLEQLSHGGPSTILPHPRPALVSQAVQGFAAWACFARAEDDDNLKINADGPFQPLILRQVMVMRSPGTPSSADDALR
jgi:hypothetical protein